MEKKKAPHKLTVEEAKNDDNSIIEMTQAKMDELKIFKGDTVLIKGKPPSYFVQFIHLTNLIQKSNFSIGKKRKDTVCIALASEE